MSKNYSLLIAEAKKLGLKVEIISKRKEIFSVSNEKKTIIIKETLCSAEVPYSESAKLSKDKNITYKLWEKKNIPIPGTFCFHSLAKLNAEIKKIKFPVIVKENIGSRSRNIFPLVTSQEELKKIAKKFVNVNQGIIVQEMIVAKEYRVLVFNRKVIGCLNMVPPFIEGDGKSTIDKLINERNKEFKNKILKNEKVKVALQKKGLTFQHIPIKGVQIYLQNNSCLAEGGLTIDCTKQIHPEMKKLAIEAAKSINLKLAGIDLICEDISKDPQKQRVAFLEVNSRPSLDIHHYPMQGEPQNVTAKILKSIFSIK